MLSNMIARFVFFLVGIPQYYVNHPEEFKEEKSRHLEILNIKGQN